MLVLIYLLQTQKYCNFAFQNKKTFKPNNIKMGNGFYKVPKAINEPVKSYAPGSPERDALLSMYKKMYNQEPIDVPMYIGSELIRTEEKLPLTSPQEHAKVLGYLNRGTKDHVIQAIDTALAARDRWSQLPWEHRAAIFLRADLFHHHRGDECIQFD